MKKVEPDVIDMEIGVKYPSAGVFNRELGVIDSELGVKKVERGVIYIERGVKSPSLDVLNSELGLIYSKAGLC